MSIEAMKQALEALEWNLPVIEDYGDKEQLNRQHRAITSLRQAIEQAEKQEPVAWITHESKWRLTGGGNAGGTVPVHAKQSNTAKYPLYTTPQPQREWVGLTDEEIRQIALATPIKGGNFAHAIEQRLKEKNT